MDLALGVLFHRFQIIFDRVRLTFSVTIETMKINKLLVSPNERLNNIILERTIEYNTTQPQNSTAKDSNATSEIVSTWKERAKSTWPTHVLTCSSQVNFYGTSLLAVTIVNNYAVTCPCKKLSGVAILVSLQECGFSRT